jgi:hypothetical protein
LGYEIFDQPREEGEEIDAKKTKAMQRGVAGNASRDSGFKQLRLLTQRAHGLTPKLTVLR